MSTSPGAVASVPRKKSIVDLATTRRRDGVDWLVEHGVPKGRIAKDLNITASHLWSLANRSSGSEAAGDLDKYIRRKTQQIVAEMDPDEAREAGVEYGRNVFHTMAEALDECARMLRDEQFTMLERVNSMKSQLVAIEHLIPGLERRAQEEGGRGRTRRRN